VLNFPADTINRTTKEESTMNAKLWAAAVCLMVPGTALGQQPDRSQYTLFNPTPDELLRPLSTDRPDKTESPFTLDAGRFQIESDLLFYSQDKTSNEGQETTRRSLIVNQMLLRAGLTQNIDVHALVQSHATEQTETSGVKETKGGFGDITLRAKINLLGNDGGEIALGLMPFVKIPTAGTHLGNGAIEGGLIFPISIGLGESWQLSTMAQIGRLKNSSGEGHHTQVVSTLSLGRRLTDRLSGFVELYSESRSEDQSPWVATFDTGITYALSANSQLDAGMNVGLTDSADDFNPFVGFSVRF
jgi:hypothetical protein